jgi:hypothetical protein
VPALVLHRTGSTPAATSPITSPGAKLVELPGVNHAPFNEPDRVDRIADEIEEFLTGSRAEVEFDRVLATDIVASTKRAAQLGDRQWRALLDRHDEAVRQQIARKQQIDLFINSGASRAETGERRLFVNT